eukprot:c12379_g1_i2.p2 GENE.c12379_g1_i2~~c12379_g1_i2.p2  ORF type:complete len:112 (+),score=20.51 c12379_g1_i2:112-447(+)
MGVKIEVIRPGDGETFPQTGCDVEVEYIAMLDDGTVWDTTARRRPFRFPFDVGAVIPGWDEGIADMSEGERARLTISPDFAYGELGLPGLVPPNTTIIFEATLLRVHPPAL